MNRKFSWNSAWKLFVQNFLPEIRQGAKFPASDLQQWGHGSFLAFKTGQLQLPDPLSFHPRSAMKKQLSWLSISHFVYMRPFNYFQSSFLNPPIPAKFWFQGRILLQWTYSTSTTNNTIEFIIQGVDCGRECNYSRLEYQGILKRFYSQGVCQGCCCRGTQKLHNSTCSGQPELAFITSSSATRSSVLKIMYYN